MKLTETERKDVSALAIDTAALIALIAFLSYIVILLLLPFATILLWAAILAVAVHPAFTWLEARLGGRKGLAATALSLGLLMRSWSARIAGSTRSSSGCAPIIWWSRLPVRRRPGGARLCCAIGPSDNGARPGREPGVDLARTVLRPAAAGGKL